MDKHKLWDIQNEAYMRGYEDGWRHMAESIKSDIDDALKWTYRETLAQKKTETLSGFEGEKNDSNG